MRPPSCIVTKGGLVDEEGEGRCGEERQHGGLSTCPVQALQPLWSGRRTRGGCPGVEEDVVGQGQWPNRGGISRVVLRRWS